MSRLYQLHFFPALCIQHSQLYKVDPLLIINEILDTSVFASTHGKERHLFDFGFILCINLCITDSSFSKISTKAGAVALLE